MNRRCDAAVQDNRCCRACLHDPRALLPSYICFSTPTQRAAFMRATESQACWPTAAAPARPAADRRQPAAAGLPPHPQLLQHCTTATTHSRRQQQHGSLLRAALYEHSPCRPGRRAWRQRRLRRRRSLRQDGPKQRRPGPTRHRPHPHRPALCGGTCRTAGQRSRWGWTQGLWVVGQQLGPRQLCVRGWPAHVLEMPGLRWSALAPLLPLPITTTGGHSG